MAALPLIAGAIDITCLTSIHTSLDIALKKAEAFIPLLFPSNNSVLSETFSR